MTKKEVYEALKAVLGEHFVQNSGLAIPELLDRAAAQIFYMCGDDKSLGHNSYLIRLAMYDIRTYGDFYFEDE